MSYAIEYAYVGGPRHGEREGLHPIRVTHGMVMPIAAYVLGMPEHLPYRVGRYRVDAVMQLLVWEADDQVRRGGVDGSTAAKTGA